MNLKKLCFAIVVMLMSFGSVSLLTSCGGDENSEEKTSQVQSQPTDQSQVSPKDQTTKAIELPHDEPEFPPGKGHDAFVSRCGVCHSLRYVTMQPDFPEATWTKEVDKMIKTFGAHITEPEAKEIVEYLTAIKGKPAEKK